MTFRPAAFRPPSRSAANGEAGRVDRESTFWLVLGLAAAAIGLGGFAVAHSWLILWANPRFQVGVLTQGLVPALVGGLAAAWLYQRLAPRLLGPRKRDKERRWYNRREGVL